MDELSDTKTRNATPSDKEYAVADGQGLSVVVRPNGTKLWLFRYRFGGQRKNMSFGTFRRARFALARRWPQVLSNAVDPGWARTRMGGPGAPVDLDTGQRTQTWLAVSDEPPWLLDAIGIRQEQPAGEVMDIEFQDELIAKLGELTGVALSKGLRTQRVSIVAKNIAFIRDRHLYRGAA
jgi:hypothetical protein